MQIFQYISCYCLSISSVLRKLIAIDFNTSHVTVYLYFHLQDQLSQVDFNTSHVTVYQYFLLRIHQKTHISIHLMLLFIRNVEKLKNSEIEFQYISCYCLSWIDWVVRKCPHHFNTSHVTVYQRWNKR